MSSSSVNLVFFLDLHDKDHLVKKRVATLYRGVLLSLLFAQLRVFDLYFLLLLAKLDVFCFLPLLLMEMISVFDAAALVTAGLGVWSFAPQGKMRKVSLGDTEKFPSLTKLNAVDPVVRPTPRICS